jgi:hypothetical protein
VDPGCRIKADPDGNREINDDKPDQHGGVDDGKGLKTRRIIRLL